MQTSWFFVLQYLNSTTFIFGVGGSDFLYSQTLAGSEQISYFIFLFSFVSNAYFWFSLHIYFC